MQVREVMTENPAVCTPGTSIQEVARMMVAHDCGAVPIVENTDTAKPMGIITDRDIVARLIAEGENPLNLRVQDAMTHTTITVQDVASVEEAIRLMKDKQVRRLVVVNQKGECSGIVSLADLAREASPDEVEEVLEEVSMPSGTASKVSHK